MSAWLSTVLRETARVTQAGGHIILLAADIPGSAVPASLTLTDSFPVRILGTNTTVWHFQRR
jgi:hypothetical protein